MADFLKWLDGKKTYAICAGVLACCYLKHRNIAIPEEFYMALTALAVAALRSAIK